MTRPLLLRPEEIREQVHRLGEELSAAHDDGVVLVGILKGSVVFLADLVRAMRTNPIVDFLAVSPYAAGTGRVRVEKDLDAEVEGRDVVLVDAVLDTGLTLSYLRRELGRRGARTVEVCVLVDKISRRLVPVQAAYVGFTVEDAYLVGYGLDHDERYRNVASLVGVDPLALAADPDRLVPSLYGRG